MNVLPYLHRVRISMVLFLMLVMPFDVVNVLGYSLPFVMASVVSPIIILTYIRAPLNMNPYAHKQQLLVALYLCVVSISFLHTQGEGGYDFILINILHCLVFYAVMLYAVSRDANIEDVYLVVIVTATLIGVINLLNVYFGMNILLSHVSETYREIGGYTFTVPRTISVTETYGVLGIYLTAGCVVSIDYACKGKWRLFSLLCYMLIMLAAVDTQSRTIYVAVMSAHLIYFIVYLVNNKKYALLTAFVIIFVVAMQYVYSLLIGMHERTYEIRMSQYVEVLDYLYDFYLFGTAGVAFQSYSGSNIGLHNTFLEVIWYSGILGLGVYLTFIYLGLLRAYKMQRIDNQYTALFVVIVTTLMSLQSFPGYRRFYIFILISLTAASIFPRKNNL